VLQRGWKPRNGAVIGILDRDRDCGRGRGPSAWIGARHGIVMRLQVIEVDAEAVVYGTDGSDTTASLERHAAALLRVA